MFNLTGRKCSIPIAVIGKLANAYSGFCTFGVAPVSVFGEVVDAHLFVECGEGLYVAVGCAALVLHEGLEVVLCGALQALDAERQLRLRCAFESYGIRHVGRRGHEESGRKQRAVAVVADGGGERDAVTAYGGG